MTSASVFVFLFNLILFRNDFTLLLTLPQLHQVQVLNNFGQPMKTLVASKSLNLDFSFSKEDTFEKTIFVGGGRETVSILKFQPDDSNSSAFLSCMNSCTASVRPQVSGVVSLFPRNDILEVY